MRMTGYTPKKRPSPRRAILKRATATPGFVAKKHSRSPRASRTPRTPAAPPAAPARRGGGRSSGSQTVRRQFNI